MRIIFHFFISSNILSTYDQSFFVQFFFSQHSDHNLDNLKIDVTLRMTYISNDLNLALWFDKHLCLQLDELFGLDELCLLLKLKNMYILLWNSCLIIIINIFIYHQRELLWRWFEVRWMIEIWYYHFWCYHFQPPTVFLFGQTF